jgi:ATP synthase F1 complex assembly factor 1
VRDLPPQEIEALWRLRHVKNPLSVCACIPLDTYRRIAAAARQNPQFILPLPRQTEQDGGAEAGEAGDGKATSSGADIHFLQWAFHPPASPATPGNTHTSTVIFTHLAAFKTQGSYAQPHTTLTHHLDLAQDKGIVLMQGQVMPDSGVSAPEASWLASCVQRFYDFGGQAEGRKGELVRMFTKGDAEGFKVEALLDEAEKL